jgi:dTDP-4-amino-4,6-dideoxygalactose transaminase
MNNSQATIPLFKVAMTQSKEFDEDILNVLHSGFITQGPRVDEFENKLKEFMKYQYILTLNSGTSALTLAFRLLNLSPNDEVISTPLTCTATNFAILANNLSIKWADVDPNTCNIDLDDLKNKLTVNTKAICFVHWGGNVINYDKLEQVQQYAMQQFGHRIPVVEDCAHAFGAPVNYQENICIFSLQAIKHLTSVDGGIISLPNKEMYDRAKLLRWFGIDREQKNKGDFRIEADIPEWGHKYHMNDVNATIGIHNLLHVQGNIDWARDVAKYYNEELKNISSVKLLNINPDKSAYWLYTFLIKDRDNFIEFMKNKKVQASQVHKRNDKHSCLKNSIAELPQLELIDKQYVSIPIGWWISLEDRQYIVECIREWDTLQKNQSG